jgi:hypothetical protein
MFQTLIQQKIIVMKKILTFVSAVLIGIHSFASDPGEIDKKIRQSFESIFPNAADVNWQELPDAYVVYFVEAGTPTRVLYAKDQSFTRFTRYYGEDKLPSQVHYAITSAYAGKKIFGVTEITTVSQVDKKLSTEYFVVLEDAKSWVTVKIDGDGNFSVVKKLKKTS